MSYYEDEYELTLTGDTFNALKNDFDQVLRKTLTNMEAKGSEYAELNIKLKITLLKDTAPDFFQPTENRRDIVVPKFDHKVSSIMQIKNEITGSMGGDYELIWDENRGEYVMRKILGNQTCIFDADYIVVHDDDEEYKQEDKEYAALPSSASEEPDNEEDSPDDNEEEPTDAEKRRAAINKALGIIKEAVDDQEESESPEDPEA